MLFISLNNILQQRGSKEQDLIRFQNSTERKLFNHEIVNYVNVSVDSNYMNKFYLLLFTNKVNKYCP